MPEESREGTAQKCMQRKEFKIISAQPVETEQRQVGEYIRFRPVKTNSLH